MPRGSMFDEKKDFIKERYESGATVQQILDELNSEWYDYAALYRYIRKHFQNGTRKHVNCEECCYFVWLQSPYGTAELPACIKLRRVFTKSLSDFPYHCKFMEGK